MTTAMTMTAARNSSEPRSFNPARTTAMTISATRSAATTPTTHKGTVKVPLARSRPGTESRFITHTPAPPIRRQYDATAQSPLLQVLRTRLYCAAAWRLRFVMVNFPRIATSRTQPKTWGEPQYWRPFRPDPRFPIWNGAVGKRTVGDGAPKARLVWIH